MAYAQRLERETDTGVREAFRALHQGLSCLAGQISATDSHSAHVAAQLTSNWEEMARRLSDMRADLDTARQVLEARLSVSEKTGQYNGSALDHALEKIEALARQRAVDQAENQRQAARHEQLLERLSEAFLRLEKRLPDASFADRLDTVEQAVAGLSQQKKPDQPASPLLTALEALSQRLEALEKDRASLLAELRAPAPRAIEEPAPETSEQETAEQEEAPDFEDIFARPANYLGAARMPAHAAPDANRPRHHFAATAVFVAIVASAAAVALEWRTEKLSPINPPVAPRAYAMPQSPNADAKQFVVAPQPVDDQNDPAPKRLEPDSSDNVRLSPPPLKQRVTRTMSVKTAADVRKAGTQAAVMSSGDRVQQLAAQGNVIALTILGLGAADGGTRSANPADAVKYLTLASEKGQPVAQYRLGSLYEHGQGVAADPIKAAHWYALSATQGNRKAMHNLAVFYASRKDMADAARWFAKAAALGLPDSQFNLAILYERGAGVPQSLAEAFKWYAIAAAAGDDESKTRMSLLQTQLNDADKAAAAQGAASFHPVSIDQHANTAPQASDLPSG
jgi:TPR repeat protein